MEDVEIGHFIAFADTLANESGKIARHYFRSFGKIDDKSDSSPVTIADTIMEEKMREMIMSTFPDHGIVGEELGIHKEDSEYKWILDPIDGTTSFMIGRPIFGTLISLVREVKPVLGIINQPITMERWVGVPGEFSSFNGNSNQVRKCGHLHDAILCSTSPNYFNIKELTAFANVANNVRYVVYGGDCYNYGLLASGMVDIVIESGLKAHDFCALVAVVEAAGGIITDWDGKPITLYSDGKIIASGSRRVHERALEMLKINEEVKEAI